MPRGRRSAADSNVVRMPHARPAPPAELGEAEARHWRELVESMPSDWLGGAAAPLLARLCAVIVQCEGFEAEIREMRRTQAPLDLKLLDAHLGATTLLMKLAQ